MRSRLVQVGLVLASGVGLAACGSNSGGTGGGDGSSAGGQGDGAGGSSASNGGGGGVGGGNSPTGGRASGGSGGGGGGPSGGVQNPAGGGGNAGGGVDNAGGGGGSEPLSGELTDVSQFTPAEGCTVTPMVVSATGMPMVGIATFSTTLEGAERAIIQFGKTAEYTLEAPVEWANEGHRTLMLGMTPSTDWHYRVVAIQGTTACIGEDNTFKTGAAVAGSPGNKVPTQGESSTAPTQGFRVVATGNNAVIWNEAGELVWSYNFGMIVSVNMSWDGKYMYARDTGPFDEGSGGNIYRVPMEGGTKEKMAVTGGSHHDVVAIPTGFAYIAKIEKGACDHVFTADPDGKNSKSLVDLDPYFAPFTAQSTQERCHVNAITYYDDATKPFYTLSDREKDVVIRIDATTGELLESIGKEPQGTAPSHILAEGGGTTWRVQHGHHWYEPNKFVVFSNGSFNTGMGSGGSTSKVIHYTIDGSGAAIDWTFSTGSSPTLSNVIHLPSGNFLVFAGQAQELIELDASGKAIQTMDLGSGGGYARYRATLYGPPMQY